ncbi:MAG: hypothetical protein AAF922_13530 [Pseudomonadota bacterium]
MKISDIQGHWQRDWLRSPGLEDRATCVNWMQCGALYADIRIPRIRPQTRGATSLADLSCASLLKLMRAEGFAGEISLKDSICTWEREIDWHGPKDTPDAGRLELIGDGAMLETGVAADYSEQWKRADSVADGALCLNSESRLGFLMTVGERFVFGLGPASVDQVSTSAAVISALEAGHKDEAALAAHFESVYIYGRWQHGVGIAIQATNPLLEGERIVFCNGRDVTFEHMTYHGERQNLALESVDEVAAVAVSLA